MYCRHAIRIEVSGAFPGNFNNLITHNTSNSSKGVIRGPSPFFASRRLICVTVIIHLIYSPALQISIYIIITLIHVADM
jgi:hypothetical protein